MEFYRPIHHHHHRRRAYNSKPKKKAVGRTHMMQALDPPSYTKQILITNKVATNFFVTLSKAISYALNARPTTLSRLNDCRLIVLFLAVLLTACGPLKDMVADSSDTATTPRQPEEALALAQTLSDSGNYGGAINLLDETQPIYPDDERIQKALTVLRKTWNPRRRELEDRLLVIRTESLQKQIPIQEKWLRGDPDDAMLRSQIEHRRRELDSAHELLKSCGKRQTKHNKKLSRQCLSLALTIREDAGARELLSKLDSQRKRQHAKISKKQKVERSTDQLALTTAHLHRARELAKKSDDRVGFSGLDAIVTSDLPSLKSAPASGDKRKKAISGVTDKLLMIGDQLYSTGEVETAIACWQAILALDPTIEEAGQKLERAQKVMENLRTLQKKKAAAPLPKPKDAPRK